MKTTLPTDPALAPPRVVRQLSCRSYLFDRDWNELPAPGPEAAASSLAARQPSLRARDGAERR